MARFRFQFLPPTSNLLLSAIASSDRGEFEMSKFVDSFVKSSNKHASNDVIILSTLDQIMPRFYIHLILCLPAQAFSKEDQTTIFFTLKKGLQKTLVEIPYLGGVVVEDKAKGGQVHIAPGLGVLLRLKDLRYDTDMSYQKMKNSHFPMSNFGDDMKAPVDQLSLESNPPVMAAQVNIVQGGVLLAMGIHHNVMDGAGFATVIQAWASNTKTSFLSSGASGNEAAKPGFLPYSSLDRSSLFKASATAEVDPQVKIKDYPQYKLDLTPPIKDLKDAPTALLTSKPPPMTLAVSITRARKLPGRSTENHKPLYSRLGLAVNGRGRLSPTLSPSYLGNVILCPSILLPVSTVSKTTELSSIASTIRTAITEINNDSVQDVITLTNALPNVTDLKGAHNSFLGPDLAITSWRDMGLIGLDWGTGMGKVEAFRHPKDGFDGLCIVLPALADGGLKVLVGLENGAMKRLKEDESFMAVAEMR
ncbi:hypothetical protein MMC22_003603 [Lobaria immixta]|nr:hypothetical protein [Lobaria immixta]